MAGRDALTRVPGVAGPHLLLLLLLSFASAPQAEGQAVAIPQYYPWLCQPYSVPGGGYWPPFINQQICNVVPTSNKVRLDVYFESNCSDSMRFFTDKLYPTWTQLKDIMDLHFIPFGKAKATPTGGDYTFECQHGPIECHGNKVLSCVQSSFPIETQVDMMSCMMAQDLPPHAGPQCSGQLGLDWTPLDTCSRSTTGSYCLYQNGVKTAALNPRVHFIPTVTIGEGHNQVQLTSNAALRSFKSRVCQAYKGPSHPNCP